MNGSFLSVLGFSVLLSLAFHTSAAPTAVADRSSSTEVEVYSPGRVKRQGGGGCGCGCGCGCCGCGGGGGGCGCCCCRPRCCCKRCCTCCRTCCCTRCCTCCRPCCCRPCCCCGCGGGGRKRRSLDNLRILLAEKKSKESTN